MHFSLNLSKTMVFRSCLAKLGSRRLTKSAVSSVTARYATKSSFESEHDASTIRDSHATGPPIPETAPRLEKSINQVILLGRVGNPPQLRGTEEHPVTVFTLATHTNYKYSTGDLQQKTEWHRITVFKPFLRDSVYKYLSKGQRALVQGKIMYGQITDAGGTIHTTTSIAADEVIFFNKVTGQQHQHSSIPDDDLA